MIPAVRLATHEAEDLIHATYQEAKLKRLQQVREQASKFAKRVREGGEEKKKRYLRSIQNEMQRKAQAEKKVQIQQLEEEVLECLTHFGCAHARAEQENQADYDAQRERLARQNRQKAEKLGKQALKELQMQKEQEHIEKTKPLIRKQQVLDAEAVRSSYIVSLPPVKFVDPNPPKEQPPKVLLFDKSTLFQTEYVMKGKVVEPIANPKDAREAAILSEIETQQLNWEQQQRKMENDRKISRRGREALLKEKSHTNYLRLLEELDKMETKPDKQWDIDSTATSMDHGSLNQYSEPTSPTSSPRLSCQIEEEPVRERKSSQQLSQVAQYKAMEEDEIPVRDRPLAKPTLSSEDVKKLNEIAVLLKELKEEEDQFLISDQTKVTRPKSSSSSGSSRSDITATTSSDVTVFSDDDLEIRCGVTEGSSSSNSTQQSRKDLASILNAIRKERKQLDSLLEHKQIPKPGILRKQASPLAASATSTPLAKPSQSDEYRRQILKHYVQKLLDMKRQDVRELSVSTSSSSTPKPTQSFRVMSTTPENWSKRTESSAYDSPAAEQSTSKSSNASSLPLGAEAAIYSRDNLFSLAPILDVYNDVYKAYNERVREHPPLWQETESSFMSLGLSVTASSARSSVEISLSSSSGKSSQPTSMRDWAKISAKSSDSTTLSVKSANSSSTSSENISMPDVDEALRRLGLPSMQSVLRR